MAEQKSPDTSSPQQTPPQQVSTVRSPLYRTIYTNTFRYRITPADFSITLQLVSDTPGSLFVNLVTEEAEIVMSHTVVKNLLLHLTKVIAAFEKEFGSIKDIPFLRICLLPVN